MERLYRGLVWLAGATLIVGVVASYLYASSVFTSTQAGISFSESGGSSSSIAVFFQLLTTQWSTMALSLSNLLNGGVIILAATLAWATHRRIWLAAMILATLLMIIWPSIVFLWQTHYLSAQFAFSNAPEFHIYSYIYISEGVQLIPVALALVFGLNSRRAAIARTDATLGIERSAL